MREDDNSDHSSAEFIMKDHHQHQRPSSSSLSGKKRKETESSSSGINNDNTPRPCTECGKKFWSWKALFGHMRCHPERHWRGINPPPNFRRHQQQQQLHSYIHGSTSQFSYMTPVDHEVAACLLLLANSNSKTNNSNKTPKHKAAAAVDDSPSVMVMENQENNSNNNFVCSCCNKVFGSHQALGGHRASHKNVKGCFANTISSPSPSVTAYTSKMMTWTTQQTQGGDGGGAPANLHHHGDEYQNNQPMMMMMVARDGYNADVEGEAVNENNNGVGGGHKCDICLKVFTTGQALGGHKRCHCGGGGGGGHNLNVDLNFPLPPLLPPSPHDDHPSPLTLDLRLGL